MTITTLRVMQASDGGVIGPVRDSETWATHFTNNSYADIQDQIDAGYNLYALPADATDGYYEEDFDLGAVYAVARIVVDASWITLAGTPSVQIDISHKTNSGDGWTDETNTVAFVAQNVRYVKIRINFIASTAGDLLQLERAEALVDVKTYTEGGIVACASGDTGGTTVNFGLSYQRVTAIIATPIGTTELKAVVDFADAANPTSFKILVYNSGGSRASADVSYAVRGIL